MEALGLRRLRHRLFGSYSSWLWCPNTPSTLSSSRWRHTDRRLGSLGL
jgi:hypothetical protein